MHEFLELHPLHTINIFLAVSSVASRNPSSAPLLTSQQDSASSAPLLKQPDEFSLSCSIVLLRETTMASFSWAILCHVWFSNSSFFRNSPSSTVLLAACAISSSFCFNIGRAFDSSFFNNDPSCRLFCSCNTNLNLSFCFQKMKRVF